MEQKYNVVKVFRISGRRKILHRKLERERAKAVVKLYPDSQRSMVVFEKAKPYVEDTITQW